MSNRKKRKSQRNKTNNYSHNVPNSSVPKKNISEDISVENPFEDLEQSLAQKPENAANVTELLEDMIREIAAEETRIKNSHSSTSKEEATEDSSVKAPIYDVPERIENEILQNKDVFFNNTAEIIVDDKPYLDEFLVEENAEAETEAETEADDEVKATSNFKDTKFYAFLVALFPVKGDKGFEIMRKCVFLLSFAVLVYSGSSVLSTLLQSKAMVDDKEKAKDIVVTTAATTIDEHGVVVTIPPTEEQKIEHNNSILRYYRNINEDVLACIRIDGCDLYEPVVQGEDNFHYLTKTYNGKDNKAGAIFFDHRVVFTEEERSPNLVIYGHNQKDGTMFGNLKFYKNDVEFYAQNPVITLNTDFGYHEYLIFAYFITNTLPEQSSDGVVFNYHDYIDVVGYESMFDHYLNEIQKRNNINTPVDVAFGDELITLSTCSNEFNDSRFVVFGRKLRDGESVEDYDFSEASINYNAMSLDWDAITSNMTTTNGSIRRLDDHENVAQSIDLGAFTTTLPASEEFTETEVIEVIEDIPAETAVPFSEELLDAEQTVIPIIE